MNRREYLKLTGGAALAGGSLSAPAANRTQIVNAAEHAWVIHDPRFAPDPRLSNCPDSIPNREYSREHLLAQMNAYGIDKVVISHVCYYGTNNSYPSYCVRTYPDKFAAIGLLVGHRLHSPDDVENPSRARALDETGAYGRFAAEPYLRQRRRLDERPGQLPSLEES